MNDPIILTSPLRIMTPIVKVVGNFCNCRCKYCFYHSKDQSTTCVMSVELLKEFVKQYMELFSRRLIFIWHGGEPLLAGLDFFKEVVNVQLENLKDGQSIQNRIQTNGTLINDKWAEFFKINNFRVGVSLDGNKESHNRFRVDRKGRETFDRAMRGIRILRRYGIEPGIMQTLTSDNMSHIKDNFDFFSNTLNVKGWSTNVYLDLGEMNKNMLNQSVTPDELTRFLMTYIDLWLSRDDPNLKIREIENFISGIFGKAAPNCTFNGCCTNYFCLDYDGKTYPCDRFSNRSSFILGDLSRQSLLEILNSSTRLRYAEDVNSLHPDCVVCEWREACHNGCTSHRTGGVKGKYYYCKTRKDVFDYLRKKLTA